MQVAALLRLDVAAHIERIVDPQPNDRHARDDRPGDLARLDRFQQDDEPAFVRLGRLDATKRDASFEFDQVGARRDDRPSHAQDIESIAVRARVVGNQDDPRVGEVRLGLGAAVPLTLLEIPRRVDERVERGRRDFELLPGLYFAEMVHGAARPLKRFQGPRSYPLRRPARRRPPPVA